MTIREARKQDVPYIVELLADDKLGKLREEFTSPLPETYNTAYDIIENDENQELMVGVNDLDEIIATVQLTFIQYLNYRGGIRAQIESVRTRSDLRGQGIGKELIMWAIDRARIRNAHLVQLTSDKKRPKSIDFYRRLGFKDSHEGMKLHF